MPRGGSRSSGRSSSPPPQRSAPTTQAPIRNTAPAQPQQQTSGGMFSGFGSTLVQGMAFGAGSEVAHQAVRSLMGGSGHSQPQQQVVVQDQGQQSYQPCQFENDQFAQCLKFNTDSINACQSYFEILKGCQTKH